MTSLSELYWLVIGNALYSGVGIALAFLLGDDRAFCTYVCPIPVLQKLPSRFSVMKIAGNYDLWNDCDGCVKMCPMDIRIPDYLKQGKRIRSTECTFYLVCVNVYAKKALHTSFGFDVGGLEILSHRTTVTE